MIKKIMLLCIVLFNALNVFAHGADVSTMVFKEQEDNTWSLQIRSSLDAFRKEVKTHFYDCPYTTKEEFNEQVLEHFDNTLKVSINNQDIVLGNGKVKLGHETVVFYNKIKVPKNIDSFRIVGTMFKEIYRSRIKVLIIKKGLEKKPLMLSRKNNFTLDIHLRNEQIKLNYKEEES